FRNSEVYIQNWQSAGSPQHSPSVHKVHLGHPFLASSLLCPPIHPQNFHKSSYLLQMAERQAHSLIAPTLDIDEEAVFPGLPAHRPRFNLAQVEIAQGKYAKSLKQSPRYVFQRKHQRSLICAGGDFLPPLDEEKPREVPLVVFQSGAQHARAV